MGCGGLLAPAGLQEEQVITWFQFQSYLQRQSISDLEKHLTQLTKEGREWWWLWTGRELQHTLVPSGSGHHSESL